MRALLAAALPVMLGLGTAAAATIPTQPGWAENPGTPALEDAAKIRDRYYCNLRLPSGELVRMWYVETSRTTSQNQPFPMGAMSGSLMAPYHEMHRPGDFRRYPFDPAGEWAGGYGLRFEHDLWVADTEVSMKVWNEVMGGRPGGWPASHTDADNDGRDDTTGFIDYAWDAASEDPVIYVSHVEAETFCTQLASSLSLGNHELELPTEAEWEFFARGIDAPDGGDPWPAQHDDWTWWGVSTESNPGQDVSDDSGVYAGVRSGGIREGESYSAGSTDEGDGWPDVGGNGTAGANRVVTRDVLVGSWINDQRHLPYRGDYSRWEAKHPADPNPYHNTNAQRYRVTSLVLQSYTVPNPFGPDKNGVTQQVSTWKMDLEVQRITYRTWNAFGISHVGGNVAEWVADAWDGHSPYNTLGANRNLGTAVGNAAVAARMPDLHGSMAYPADGHRANTVGDLRVTRGGSWLNGNRECRPSSRAGLDPRAVSDQVGFRFVIRAVP